MEPLPFFQPPCISVSDLTHYLKQLFESDEILQEVWVEGEISNCSHPTSGHVYFTLKDAGASLRCVIWRNTAQRLRVHLQDGTAIQAHGSVSLYEAGGQYQLYIDQVRPAGEGLLYLEFLRLKARLEAEGVFDVARKRPIPACPQRIGIVTSPTGAAFQDMLNTIRRRYPLVEVILAPTPVQGDEAAPSIAAAITALNRAARPDVILLARGGGSIEDLWAFNDERVAYAIVASAAPVITGVGHETDLTIADFVADLRAPTPTAAAELATPDQADLRAALQEQVDGLVRGASAAIDQHRWDLNARQHRLRLVSPLNQIRENRQRLDDLSRAAGQNLSHALRLQRAHLQGVQVHLGALNPLAILQRGFAILTRPEDGQVVRSVHQARAGETLQVRLADGSLGAQVIETRPEK